MVPHQSAPEPARAAGRAESHPARTLRRLRTLRERAGAMYTLVVTARLNDLAPQVWMGETCSRRHVHSAFRPRRRLSRQSLVFRRVEIRRHDELCCLGRGRRIQFTVGNGFSARNTCNEYMNLTVCWTGHEFPDSNYRCDKSHPIPPANWAGLKPGESTTALKGEFVWWAWRCEE